MKIELHIHTCGFSHCGVLSTAQAVELYHRAGYDAIVITNHFSTVSRQWFWEHGGKDYLESHFAAVEEAAEYGRQCGLLVMGGLELRFNESENDYLVYGMSKEQCADHEKIFAMTPVEFGEFARRNGILFYQAHPFRNKMKIVPPEALFGIEVLNTHPRHDSRNELAAMWAEKYSLHRIPGTDCHLADDVGSSALFTDFPVKNMDDLIHVLRNDLYTFAAAPAAGEK